MKMISIYLDSDVIIKWEQSEYKDEIDALVGDEKRIFYSSIFLEMEVLPYLVLHKKVKRIEFLETFFKKTIRIPVSSADIKTAFWIQKEYGVLGTVDSIHLSLCRKAMIDEFVTLEKTTRAIYNYNKARNTSVIHLRKT